MSFRQVVFWIHLGAGVLAGTIIAIMSATGVAIAFEEEILTWIDREASSIQPSSAAEATPRPIAELTQLAEQARPGFTVTSVTVFRDPTRAHAFYAGREGPLYVNPHTGAVRDSQAHDAHEIIHKLEEWHRWLGAANGTTSAARVVTGVSNLAFLVLCVTGLYLWFPRQWSLRALRPRLRFIRGYVGKARDFNWHHVFGFWSLPVLIVLVATAVPISFAWGHRLVFAVFGEAAPKARNYGMMAVPPAVVPAPPGDGAARPIETFFASAQQAFPEWQSVHVTLPSQESLAALEPVEAGVTLPDSMPSRAYVPLEMDPFTGTVLQATPFQERSPGLRARVWIRFLHTGAAFGLPGKIIATLATAASLVLVYTGFALSWRRLTARRSRPAVRAAA